MQKDLSDHYQNVVNFKNQAKDIQDQEMAKLDSQMVR